MACEYPPGLTNGVVSVTQLGVGGIALYQCNAEYSLTGSPNRICLSDGKWSGEIPTCTHSMYVEPYHANVNVLLTST